ncbi:MAG: alpha/beta hydrolase [Firmicutes bacterium]|nr:alpha/beta hydrolase [Bacillota bacterium]
MITENSTFNDILSLPSLSDIAPYLTGGCPIPDLDMTLAQMQEHRPSWIAKSIASGAEYTDSLAKKGGLGLIEIYSSQQKEADPTKKQAKLIFMKGKKDMPFVVICAGGYFTSLCHFKESFPPAAALNKLGYNCFILNYRLAVPFPLPMDDLAAAVGYILENASKLGVSKDGYSVMGFSAGGYIAAAFGTKELGAPAYSLPLPACIMGGYPLLRLKVDNMPQEVMDKLAALLLGKNWTEADLEKYDITDKLTAGYPAFYLWHCRDDMTVLFCYAEQAAETMQKNSVKHIFRPVESGGHGIGLGEYSQADGWLDEAVKLWEENR